MVMPNFINEIFLPQVVLLEKSDLRTAYFYILIYETLLFYS